MPPTPHSPRRSEYPPGEERGDDNGDDNAQPHFDTLGDRFLAENGAVEISAMMRSIGQK
jgi:hypothetical protein